MSRRETDILPRVFSCVPSRACGRIEALTSHYCLPTRGKVEIIPGLSTDSLLAHGFNSLWAAALNYNEAGAIDLFLLHHDDIQVLTHGWLDLMVEEMERVGAAVLSVVQPIKDESGLTSTALETTDPWRPQKLTLDQIAGRPETFTELGLLINTGLMLVDLSRSEFHEEKDGEAFFHFRMQDRIVRGEDGQRKAQCRPEDWEFSRMCHSWGLPVYVTRKVACLHWGDKGYSNQARAR